jgi:hypothetical protein
MLAFQPIIGGDIDFHGFLSGATGAAIRANTGVALRLVARRFSGEKNETRLP